MTQRTTKTARRQRAHRAIDNLHTALLAHDMDEFADQWAPHGTMTFPFAPPGWPRASSREEVRDYVSNYTNTVDVRSIRSQVRHETADPDTIIVEWAITGVALSSGRPYDLSYISVISVGEDGIDSYRDYWSALAAGAALGSLGQMTAAFATSEDHHE